jgi:hypothetical protein
MSPRSSEQPAPASTRAYSSSPRARHHWHHLPGVELNTTVGKSPAAERFCQGLPSLRGEPARSPFRPGLHPLPAGCCGLKCDSPRDSETHKAQEPARRRNRLRAGHVDWMLQGRSPYPVPEVQMHLRTWLLSTPSNGTAPSARRHLPVMAMNVRGASAVIFNSSTRRFSLSTRYAG